MITLTKLNGEEFTLNSDLIETIEKKPDTTIRLTTKQYYIVKEEVEEIIEKIIAFRREINALPKTQDFYSFRQEGEEIDSER